MARPRTPTEVATANLDMMVAGARVRVALTVPTRPVQADRILPVFQTLADAVVSNAEAAEVAGGRPISCCKGCGACCRQLVPVSEIETRHIRDLVEALPEPRRSEVKARFSDAIRRLDEAGLLETLRHPERVPDEDRLELGMTYFRLGIPCPFLEEESCSIHPARPVVCREYLVTTPPANCSNPTAETVRRVPLPVQLSGTLARFGDDSASPSTTWVPLTLALEWAESHPDPSPRRPGPEWLMDLLRTWTGRDLTPP